MAKNTERLGLYMKDPETDGNDTFNITTMLNNNWESIDNKIAMVDEKGKVVNKDGSPAGGVNSVNEKQGDVTLSKDDIGLSNVDNVKQAPKSDYDSHKNDKILHTTQAEKDDWNAKETPDEAQKKVDSHADKNDNPHNVTKSQVGLGAVGNYGIAFREEAEAGDTNLKYMTPLRTKHAIEKQVPTPTKEGIGLDSVDNIKQFPDYTGELLSRVDLNDFTETGVYALGSNLTNAPTTSSNVFLYVAGEASDVPRTTQLCIRSNANATIYVRRGSGYNFTWSEWETLETVTGSQAKISAHADETEVHGLDALNIAIGRNASSANGGVAFGGDAHASIYSTVMGNSADSTGSDATVLGQGAVGSSKSVVVGRGASTSATSSVAIGYQADAVRNATAIGANAISLNIDEGVLGTTNNTSSWVVPGSFTVEGTKNFEMPHPHPDKKETHRLRHSAVESPTAGDNLYRFIIEATEALQVVEYELPDYFRHLNKDVDVWVNGVEHFGNAYGKVDGNTLKVNCEYAGKYNVLLIGTRNDSHHSVQDWGIKGVEREIGESWTGETYVFEVDEILEVEEIKEEDAA